MSVMLPIPPPLQGRGSETWRLCRLVAAGWGLSSRETLDPAERPHPNPSPEGEGLIGSHTHFITPRNSG